MPKQANKQTPSKDSKLICLHQVGQQILEEASSSGLGLSAVWSSVGVRFSFTVRGASVSVSGLWRQGNTRSSRFCTIIIKGQGD